MRSIPRRQFLQESAQAVATSAAGLTIIAGTAAAAAPSERVNLAVMGIRGRGRSLAIGFAGMEGARVVGLCDVDAKLLPPLAREIGDRQQSSEPRAEKDVRRVLEDRSIDALVIATPDHWHAPASVWACQAGKHVYVEKPASHNVREGRKMVEAARKYDRVVQLGTQCRSAPHYLDLIAAIRAGRIGRVHMAKAWNSQRRRTIGHKADAPVPAGVDYDLWLGPAPARPFNPNRFHSTWHWHWDYGTDDMGNDGVHDLDIARWGLGVEGPSTVSAAGGKLVFDDDQQVPDTQVVAFEFPATRQVLVYEQRLWSPYVQAGYENGVAFYGTDGYILCGRSGWRLFEPRNQEVPTPKRPFSDAPHRRNFLECIKTGRRPNADIEEGHRSSTLAHLGNIATRLGRRLAYDPQSETIAQDDAAAELLRRTYRDGFEVPDRV
jgi:predicted dehydrogenase